MLYFANREGFVGGSLLIGSLSADATHRFSGNACAGEVIIRQPKLTSVESLFFFDSNYKPAQNWGPPIRSLSCLGNAHAKPRLQS